MMNNKSHPIGWLFYILFLMIELFALIARLTSEVDAQLSVNVKVYLREHNCRMSFRALELFKLLVSELCDRVVFSTDAESDESFVRVETRISVAHHVCLETLYRLDNVRRDEKHFLFKACVSLDSVEKSRRAGAEKCGCLAGDECAVIELDGNCRVAGFFSLLSLIALLSVNLGVLNLLPLPVLDGGYLLILIIEGITHRKLQGRGMEIAIMCGWVFILGLFILTMWNDLARVFGL